MLLLLKKLILVLIPTALLIYVIFNIESPTSWQQASNSQILIFFLPLLFSLTFFINLFLSYLPHSFIFALGLMFLLVLWSISLFNWVTVPLTLAFTLIAFRLFPKLYYRRNFGFFKKLKLTKKQNIPKITHKL